MCRVNSQNSQQKHIPKTFVRFQNHFSLQTMVSCCELDQDRNSPFCFPLIQVNFIANISRFMKRKSFLKPVFHKSLELLTRYQVSLAPFCSLLVSQSLFALRKNTRKACGGSRAPKGRYTRGILQSSSVCTNDFMGIPHPREQNFHPAKCSTIYLEASSRAN